MPLFNTIKKAFGLGETYDIDESELADAADDPDPGEPQQPHGGHADGRQADAQSEPEEKIEEPEVDDETLTADIFAGVVEVFNSRQPEFVRDCLDAEAEKKFILDKIDSALKTRLDIAVERAREHGRNMWEAERMRLCLEVENLKKERVQLIERREEGKREKLSAERQKRALNERVHDLEAQILDMEAEKEQYQLENRSMLNRLRAAAVRGEIGDGEDSDSETICRLNDQVEALTTQLADITAQAEMAGRQRDLYAGVISSLLEKYSALHSQLQSHNASADEAQAQALAESQEALELKEKELAAALEKLEKANGESAALRHKLESVAEDMKTVNEVSARMSDIENTLSSQSARIATLTKGREQDALTIAKLNAERREHVEKIDSLTAENARGLQEIDRLNAALAQTIKDSESMAVNQKPRRGRPPKKKKYPEAKSPVDELMDSADWLVSVPPPAAPKPKPADKNDDFGYKPPVRKVQADDDKQLSLW